MENPTKLGINRTGIQMSPLLTEEMVKHAGKTVPPPGDAQALARLRGDYIAEADALGSVPVPATVKGVVKSGMEMLTGERPQVFIDKLGERLAFERSGTRLYDALITKCQASNGSGPAVPIETLRQFRKEEAEHFKLVAEAIETLGGDPTAQTPSADLVGVEAMGLMQVLNDPRTSPTQCLHAILVAEMADNDGWALLIKLAEEMGQSTMADNFRVALDDERNHLEKIRAWHQAATMDEASL